jgi:hypothetical protein
MTPLISWIIGLSVALILGDLVPRVVLWAMRRRINFRRPTYPGIPVLVTGTIERLFFLVAVAFNLSGVIVAMIGWIGVKMAAHWGARQEANEQQAVDSIYAVRISAILAGILSLFFAMVGGLICAGAIRF